MSSDALPTWSSIADWYDDLLNGGSGPHQTALACLDRLVPDVEGLDIVDVACGQGIASRHFAARGARVVGVDYSDSMIANAQRHGTPAGAEAPWHPGRRRDRFPGRQRRDAQHAR